MHPQKRSAAFINKDLEDRVLGYLPSDLCVMSQVIRAS